MNKIADAFARLAFVGAIGIAGAMSGPQAAMADDNPLCREMPTLGGTCDSVGHDVNNYLATVTETIDSVQPSGPVLYCQPDTGRCCTYNPRDPKGLCAAQPPTCETDPSLCPPPGE